MSKTRIEITSITAELMCAKCGVLLGFYRGKAFYIEPGSKETKLVCEECASNESCSTEKNHENTD